MGREVRRVPANWQHPKYPEDHYKPHLRGRYVPLHDGGGYAARAAEWDEEFAKWRAGICRSYSGDSQWEPIDPKYLGRRYSEYDGPRPSPDDYMPDWPDEQRTHLMMYEDTSEGTPISPAFATPEELARWLADNGASAFARDTASYEAWLRVCRGGFAPSMIIKDGRMQSGVEGLSDAQ
ncbi:MAG: hypothetical protein V4527_18290 [Pseudomonadota bacterium]